MLWAPATFEGLLRLRRVRGAAPSDTSSCVSLRTWADWALAEFARFGFAPLYVRHVDVFDAVEHLVAVLEREEYADPAYSSRNAVT